MEQTPVIKRYRELLSVVENTQEYPYGSVQYKLVETTKLAFSFLNRREQLEFIHQRYTELGMERFLPSILYFIEEESISKKDELVHIAFFDEALEILVRELRADDIINEAEETKYPESLTSNAIDLLKLVEKRTKGRKLREQVIWAMEYLNAVLKCSTLNDLITMAHHQAFDLWSFALMLPPGDLSESQTGGHESAGLVLGIMEMAYRREINWGKWDT